MTDALLTPKAESALVGAELQAYDFRTTARLLSCHPNTIRNLVGAGKLRVFYIGRLPRIARTEIERFIAAGQAQGGNR